MKAAQREFSRGLDVARVPAGAVSTTRDRTIVHCSWIALLLLAVLAACSNPELGSATLTWSPAEDEKVAGYNVFRAEDLNGDYQRINANLVREPRYVDQTAVRGKTYHYRVTAVTSAGVESDLSETASKTID